MTRIKKRLSKFIALITAAALCMSLPGTAFAADTEAYSVTVSEMKAGVSYSAQVSYSTTEDANTYALSSTAVTMITNYFGDEIEIVPLEDSTYNIIISFGGTTGYSSAITGIYYYAGSDFSDDDGAVLSSASAEDETATFTINAASIESDIYLSVVISGAMAGMFSPGADIVMTIDTSSLTTSYVEETDDTQEEDSGEDSGISGEDGDDETSQEDDSGKDSSGEEDSGSTGNTQDTDDSEDTEDAGGSDDSEDMPDTGGSDNSEDEQDDGSSDDSDNTEGDDDSDSSEDTQGTEGSDDSENPEDTPDTGNSDDSGETEGAGDSDDSEATEGDDDDSGDSENTQDIEGSEDSEGTDESSGGTSSLSSGDLAAGTYSAGISLTAYVSGMGGIEFGADLLEGAVITADTDGTCYITLYFTTAEVTIYGSTLETFIDASESVPGYYDGSEIKAASYTLSDDTALNPDGDEVNYVDSMTFALPDLSGSYYLWLYINSGFMGVQFCDGSGSGSSNSPGTATPYQAVLLVDFDSLELISADYDTSAADESSGGTIIPSDEDDSEDEDGGADDAGSDGGSAEEASGEEDSDDTELSSIPAGTYYPDASLSCYISSMGGIEFGAGLFESLMLTVSEDGEYQITVYFTRSVVTIYTVAADIFIDASQSAPGYYDSDGVLRYAQYTLSSDTAYDADGNAVNYVDSMTFTVESLTSEIYLYLYINSNVMGVQFCDGSGSGSSNQPGVETPYAAVLTIDWSSIGLEDYVSDTDTSDTASAASVGDSSDIALWTAMAAFALFALSALALKKRPGMTD